MRSLHTLWLVFCLVYLTSWPLAQGQGYESEISGFSHSAVLDPNGKFHVSWRYHKPPRDELRLLLEVETRGWIAFGVSPNGGMAGSDLVLGWVDDDTGQVHFHDRYATGNSMPIIDPLQDWTLVAARQNETHTVMEVSRPLLTCDEDTDREITSDTQRVIWAYGYDDPLDPRAVPKHEPQTRGTRSMQFLNPPKPYEDFIEADDEDLEVLEITAKNRTIPAQLTTYSCRVIKMPYDHKRHVVKYSPIITPGNEQFVHHMNIFECSHPDGPSVFEKHLDIDYACGISLEHGTEAVNMPPDLLHCQTFSFVWAVGGEEVVMPKEAGFPIGGRQGDEEAYFMFEIHYDNPGRIAGRIDSSGLRIYSTPKLRKYEASTMVVGAPFDFRLFIPPNTKQWKVNGHCDPRCFEKEIPVDGLNIIGLLPHGHLAARKIKVRQFRAGQELEPLEDEQHYDFNYQQIKPIWPPRKLMRGDQLTVECVMDTRGRRYPTLGGLATTDEMCAAWITYYPRMIKSKICVSGPQPAIIMALSGVEQLDNFEVGIEPRIKSPKIYQNTTMTKYLSRKKDWDYSLLQNSGQSWLLNGEHRAQCYFKKTEDAEASDGRLTGAKMIRYPRPLKPYQSPVKQCRSSGWSSSASQLWGGRTRSGLILAIGFAVLLLLD